jgi:pilus assembly protein Flp/PilA
MLFLPEEKGQGLVEYAILIAFVAIVVVVVVRILGPKVGNVFSTVNSSF